MLIPEKKLLALGRKCFGAALLSLVLMSPILLGIAPALAQSPATTSPPQQTAAPRQTAHSYKRPSLDDRVRALAKNLDLSEAQQSAVRKILEQRQQEALRLRLDPSISGSVRIDKFRALQEQTVERISAVLNDEQKQKYNPLATRKLPAAPDQRSVEDWLKATTPP